MFKDTDYWRFATVLTGMVFILLATAPVTLSAQPLFTPDRFELRAQLVDEDGEVLHNLQEVEVRFYAGPDLDDELLMVVDHMLSPTHERFTGSVIAGHGEFERVMLLRDEAAIPISQEGGFASLSELFWGLDPVWMEVVVDGQWRSERIAVTTHSDQLLRWTGENSRPSFFGAIALQRWAEDGAVQNADPVLLAPSSDPSIHTDRNGLCTWRMTCGGVAGQMKWSPTGSSCWSNAQSQMPLAVILRGNGFDYRNYSFLQDHLARNGILSASINLVSSCGGAGNTQCSAAHQSVADQAESFLTSSCFQTHFVNRFSISNPINRHRTAVIGHSRGGESARFLASTLNSRSDHTVRAVVAMAPTHHTNQPIYGVSTDAYMLLYGTLDFDVVKEQAFAAHDRAGWNDWSTPTGFDVDRSMKLLTGAGHSGFSDSGLALEAGQRSTTRGYVHAFLRAWLRDDWRFYESYIRGQNKPGTLSGPVWTQYSNSSARRVIDNFQHSALSPNTMGGAVSTFRMSQASTVEGDTLSATPHVGRLLRIRPSQSGANVVWFIPEAQQNVGGYRYLSLRIGQLDGNGPTNARLGIRNNGVYSWVNIGAYGGIPEPMGTLAHMHTVRVPLDHFGAHNNVDRVALQFQDSSGVNKGFILNNLEFSELGLVIGLP